MKNPAFAGFSIRRTLPQNYARYPAIRAVLEVEELQVQVAANIFFPKNNFIDLQIMAPKRQVVKLFFLFFAS